MTAREPMCCRLFSTALSRSRASWSEMLFGRAALSRGLEHALVKTISQPQPPTAEETKTSLSAVTSPLASINNFRAHVVAFGAFGAVSATKNRGLCEKKKIGLCILRHQNPSPVLWQVAKNVGFCCFCNNPYVFARKSKQRSGCAHTRRCVREEIVMM